VRQLLTQRQVLPEFRESGDPTERAQEGPGPWGGIGGVGGWGWISFLREKPWS